MRLFESLAINLIIQAAVCEPLSTYLQYFGRECAISSSELWALHGTQLEDVFRKMAETKCLPVDDDGVWFYDVLPSYQRERLAAYEAEMEKEIDQAKLLSTDDAVFDLERGVKRPAITYAGKPLFTMVSHGTVWHSHHRRPLLLEEWLMAHAIPVGNGLCGKAEVAADYMQLIDSEHLTSNDLKNMVGNGWHIGSIGSWFMFVLSAVEFHEGLSMPKPLPVVDDVEEVFDSPPRKKHCGGSFDRQNWSSPEPSACFTPLTHQSPTAFGGGFGEILGAKTSKTDYAFGLELGPSSILRRTRK